jgi:hypothetical protein
MNRNLCEILFLCIILNNTFDVLAKDNTTTESGGVAVARWNYAYVQAPLLVTMFILILVALQIGRNLFFGLLFYLFLRVPPFEDHFAYST